MTRPAVAVATLGPVGYWPLGPGTLASALVAPLWLLPVPWSVWGAVVAGLAVAGVAVADRAERALGPDDGRIVIDEAVGMGIALLAAPRTWAGIGVAFLLFRFLDIAKPPPIDRLQAVPGGRGVMADDVAAGIAAAALIGIGRGLL